MSDYEMKQCPLLYRNDFSRTGMENIARQRHLRPSVSTVGNVGQALCRSGQSNGGSDGNETIRKLRTNSSNSSNNDNNGHNNRTRQATPPFSV